MTSEAEPRDLRRRASPRQAVRDWQRLGLAARLLVATQAAFNVGFYAVLPFLADHLSDDLALGAGVVGFVLGLRTFSQQGLFAVGGMLADRFGPRPMIVAGCGVRSIGFVVLGTGTSLAAVIVGAMLTGVAGALFSPAVESALAAEAREPERVGGLTRTEVFALFSVSGNVGSIVGPILGTALLGVGFRVSCLVGAGLFVVIGSAHRLVLPARPGEHAGDPLLDGWRHAMGNAAFMRFASGYAVYLVAYNQLYLALPHELDRSTGSTGLLGPLFVLSSVMVVGAQVWVTARAGRLAPSTAIAGGFATMAAGFAAVLGTVVLGAGRVPSIASLVLCVVLLTVGQMTVVPVAQAFVPRLAAERHLGAHFGVLASCGGIAAVLINPVIGRLLDLGARPVMAWAVLAALPLVAGMTVRAALVSAEAGAVGAQHDAVGRTGGHEGDRRDGERRSEDQRR